MAAGSDTAGTEAAVSGSGSSSEEPALGYEQARDELIEVVRRLEAGGTSLEESLALWERGEELAKVCRRRLEGARARLDASLAAERAAERAAEAREEGGDE
ncbi:exodeoxyribonuclease VII small subunit [Streptomyces venezuelae]|uniref:exodeoxyribonuclease VII small subunit n=1 Tax=Streptomyces venezuelae TaxID=54571 RepID=UPI0037CFB901